MARHDGQGVETSSTPLLVAAPITKTGTKPGWFRALATWATRPRPTSSLAPRTDPRAEPSARGPLLIGTNGIATDLDGSLNTSWDAKFRHSSMTKRSGRLS